MMFERLVLSNFQCHKRLDLRVDPQITTIVGRSDSGKSAIFRAIRWLAFNRPRGDSFVRQGAKSVAVKVAWDEQVLARRKNGAKNTYWVGRQRLEAFGAGVPEEVRRLLRLDEINFQGQHDASFWFGLTPGEVARRLNEIVDLDLIDRVHSRLASRLRAERARLKAQQEVAEKARQRYDKLAFVPDLERQLAGLVGLRNRLAEVRTQQQRLSDVVKGLTSATKRLGRLRATLDGAQQLVKIGNAWQAAASRYLELCYVIQQAEELEAKASVELPDLSHLERAADRLAQLRNLHSNLTALCARLSAKQADLSDSRGRLSKAEQRLREAVGDVCPLCGQPVKGDGRG